MEDLKSKLDEMLYEFPLTLLPLNLPEEIIIDRDICHKKAAIGGD